LRVKWRGMYFRGIFMVLIYNNTYIMDKEKSFLNENI